jgi:hypothetical protein
MLLQLDESSSLPSDIIVPTKSTKCPRLVVVRGNVRTDQDDFGTNESVVRLKPNDCRAYGQKADIVPGVLF